MIVHNPGGQAADVILEREGERQAHRRHRATTSSKVGSTRIGTTIAMAATPIASRASGAIRKINSRRCAGRALGGTAHDPAHRQDQQLAADEYDKDEQNIAPGQFFAGSPDGGRLHSWNDPFLRSGRYGTTMSKPAGREDTVRRFLAGYRSITIARASVRRSG